jgi:hypothetical protein
VGLKYRDQSEQPPPHGGDAIGTGVECPCQPDIGEKGKYQLLRETRPPPDLI